MAAPKKREPIKKLLKFFDEELGIPPVAALLALFGLALLFASAIVAKEVFTVADILSLVVAASPVWVPIALVVIFHKVWLEYVQVRQTIRTAYAMLEIRLPGDITRTPLAMETVVNVMYHTGTPQDWYAAFFKGETRPQFSLEIASFEGDVHFFIRCPESQRRTLTAQIYSQYPSVEVVEVEDYTERIQYDESAMDLFGLEQTLAKPDPYPIKTYVDWGLDKPGLKEEEKIDPINSILEFMGSLGKGEYCFLQLIVRSHLPEKVWGEKMKTPWEKVAEKEVQNLIEQLKRETDGYIVYRPPHEGEKEIMESIERNIRKKPFDTGIRILYFAYKDGGYNKDRHQALPTMFRTFQSHTLNNLKPVFRTAFNWKISNPFGIRARLRKREIFQAYRWRAYFLPPYPRPYFVLSSEELATIYHFPGRATATPTLRREPTRKAEAPANLPR